MEPMNMSKKVKILEEIRLQFILMNVLTNLEQKHAASGNNVSKEITKMKDMLLTALEQ